MSAKTTTYVAVGLALITAWLIYDKSQTNKALKAAGKKVEKGVLVAA